MIRSIKIIILALMVLAFAANAFSQSGEKPLNTYGYFQAQFYQSGETTYKGSSNSFSMQQLNFFFQKDLKEKWSAFVNVEFVNSFSSDRNIGSINLEEAWGRYKYSDKFSIKAGLIIPTYNALNTIKNRTPLLPYIIRPLAYETSFKSLAPFDNLAPNRAFFEANGRLPAGEIKIDYAIYAGNGPNVIQNGDAGEGQISGVDSTKSILVGGRLGIRYEGFKAGVSGTRDKSNKYTDLTGNEITRSRIGLDVSLDINRFHAAAEYSFSNFDVDFSYGPQIPLDGIGLVDGKVEDTNTFYYGILGIDVTDDLYIYGMYNYYQQNEKPFWDLDVKMPSAGIAFSPSYRIKLKLQASRIKVSFYRPFVEETDYLEYSSAISIFF